MHFVKTKAHFLHSGGPKMKSKHPMEPSWGDLEVETEKKTPAPPTLDAKIDPFCFKKRLPDTTTACKNGEADEICPHDSFLTRSGMRSVSILNPKRSLNRHKI